MRTNISIFLFCCLPIIGLLAQGTWTTKAPMLTARSGAGAGVINGIFYVVGGSPPSGFATTSVESYDPLTNIWTAKASAPTSRSYPNAGVINGKLYVVGGCINSDCIVGLNSILEEYDPVSNTWATKTSMPTARSGMAVGVINNKFYVAGGMQQCGPCTALSVVEVYDPSTNAWTAVASLPAAVRQGSGAVINGKLYVAGGASGSSALATLYEYDPGTNTWATKVSMPTARQVTGSGVINNELYVVSGNTTSANTTVVEVYNPSTNTWRTDTSIPTGRYGPATGVINTTLYAAGSGATNNAITTVEAFVPATGANALAITNFTPTSGAVGTTVTITGTNFSTTPANNIVFFGATKAAVTAASLTQLTVTVPTGATYQPITVTVGGLTAYSSKPFVTTFSGGGTIDASSFAPKVDLPTGAYPDNTYFQDMDGDGKTDLLVSNGNGFNVSVFRNTSILGTITFATNVDFTTGTSPLGIVTGDLDGDGKPDMVIANPTSNTVAVFRNTSTSGTVSFAAKADLPGSQPVYVAISDLDGNGKPDLVVTNASTNTISVFRNTSAIGTISFATAVNFTTGIGPVGIALGDIDGDGQTDIVVVSQGSNALSIFRNTGTSGTISLSAKVDFTTPASPVKLAIGDLDADGKLDVVSANGAGNVSFFKNTASSGSVTASSFATRVDYTTGPNSQGISINDIDGDGKPDLAVSVVGNSAISVLKNSGTGTFGAKVDFATGTEPNHTVSVGDLDGDGKPDMAVPNALSNNVSIYRNTIAATTTPTITSFTPTSGSIGTSVTITGTNFSATPANNIVQFTGTTAAATASTATSITTSVPIGATTGAITVTVGGLTGTSGTNFTITTASPTITSFTPTSGAVGTSVTITGTNLTGATAVSFGGTPATSFSVVSATSITAVVAAGTSGNVSVTTPGGTAILAGFTFVSAPTITSFAPTSAGSGTTVTLTGTNLTGATAVSFGGTAATSFNVVSATSITAVVASGTSGSVSVSTPGGTATRTGFTFIPAPTITLINPTSAGNGTTVALTGTNLTGAIAVSFGGTPATSFSVVSATSITAVVGSGTSGNVSVTTPGGTATLAGFTFVPSPTITSFTPTSGAVGTSVTIAGTNFSATPANNTVKFNGTTATVTASAATSITTSVPTGATSGAITVTVGGQTGTSATNFTVTTASTPTITSFTPTSGAVGTSVTITGTNFSATPANNTVKFNGTTATVTASTATSITTSVPSGATTGAITVTVGGVTGTSATNFTVAIDTSPPVVTANNTLATIAPNSSISVSANFTDASGIATNPAPRVFYRPIAGAAPNTFVSANMTLSTGSTYTATIPASAVTELGVEYKYLITDGAGLDNAASQTIYKTLIDHSTGLPITSYPGSAAGTGATSYRIIAIPLVLVNKTANDVFNDVLGGYDPTTWRMFKYNGSSFNELNANSVLIPGEGYWFICVSSSQLNTGPGTTVDVSTSSPFTITLKPGWNQIGNPYNFNISWADVVAANPAQAANLGGNTSKIRVFRGAIDNVDVLKTLEGGFVKFLGSSATAISIPVAKNPSIQGRVGSHDLTTNSLDQAAWELFFSLKNGSTEYKLGGIGMHPEAKEGFDYHDDFNSPRFIEYLEVRFPKKYVGMTYTKDVVPTAENQVWQFSVESNLKAEITSLSWDNSYFGNGKEIYLLDVASHRVTNMNSQTQYDFNSATSKDFKVVFGNADYVKQELIPDKVILYEPYPNPFTTHVLIEYALPEGMMGANAEIEIFNSVGAKISSIAILSHAGAGAWQWESDGQAGGLYFVRLKVGEQYVIKKLVKQ